MEVGTQLQYGILVVPNANCHAKHLLQPYFYCSCLSVAQSSHSLVLQMQQSTSVPSSTAPVTTAFPSCVLWGLLSLLRLGRLFLHSSSPGPWFHCLEDLQSLFSGPRVFLSFSPCCYSPCVFLSKGIRPFGDCTAARICFHVSLTLCLSG